MWGVYVPLDIAGATLDTPAGAMLDKPPAFGIGSPPPIFDIGSSPPTFVICNASWACAGPCLFASFPVSGGDPRQSLRRGRQKSTFPSRQWFSKVDIVL